jgi:hypothetical protein
MRLSQSSNNPTENLQMIILYNILGASTFLFILTIPCKLMRPLPLPRSRGNSPLGTGVAPQFRMKWSVAEWLSFPETSTSEIPVVLVAESSDIYMILEAIEKEPKCVGIDIVRGPNANEPVICLAIASAIFALDSSILRPIDFKIFFTFLSGLKTALVSLQELSFADSFDRSCNFPSVKKISGIVRTPPATSALDPDSLALLFGVSCFQARQAHVTTRNLGVYSKMMAAQPSRTALPMKRQRTLLTSSTDTIVTDPVQQPPTPPLFIEDPPAEEEPLNSNARRYLEWFQ